MSASIGDPPNPPTAATAMEVDTPVEAGRDGGGGQLPISSTSPSDTVLCTPPTPGTPDLGARLSIPRDDKVLSVLPDQPDSDTVEGAPQRAVTRRAKGKQRSQGWKALPASIIE